jgi:hypothetical protein
MYNCIYYYQYSSEGDECDPEGWRDAELCRIPKNLSRATSKAFFIPE